IVALATSTIKEEYEQEDTRNRSGGRSARRGHIRHRPSPEAGRQSPRQISRGRPAHRQDHRAKRKNSERPGRHSEEARRDQAGPPPSPPPHELSCLWSAPTCRRFAVDIESPAEHKGA